MNEEEFWKAALESLSEGKDVVIVIIIQRIGSAPNVPGAKMLVTQDSIVGTVGGGASEYKLIEIAKNMLDNRKTDIETVFLDHSIGLGEEHSGMICSGSQTFALIFLEQGDKSIVEEVHEAYSKAIPGVLIISNEEIRYERGETLQKNNFYIKTKTGWEYKENIGFQNQLFMIGGGHVSLALSRIMKTLDFRITILDDRDNLPTMENNPYAHEKKVISFENIDTYIPEGENVYIVIMTFGHASDELVLEKLISCKHRYIGMMASVSKKQQVFTNLEKKGMPKELLAKVYSPIGLKIKSDTPEEIAVSIAAEIISVRNSEKGKGK